MKVTQDDGAVLVARKFQYFELKKRKFINAEYGATAHLALSYDLCLRRIGIQNAVKLNKPIKQNLSGNTQL